MKKQEMKLCKTFKMLNDYMDDQEKILYDKLHNLELSHNRKLKLLKQLKLFLNKESDYTKKTLIEKIDNELQFTGRINYGAKA